jgi:cytochrome c556
MKTRLTLNLTLAGLMLALGMLIVFISGRAEAPKNQSKRATVFMRQKLAYSQLVLEGLTLEKYDLITTYGQKMWNMAQTNLWSELLPVEYHQYSQKYRDNVLAMIDAAREKNLDGAMEAYRKSLQSCYDCHKYFRIEQRAKVPAKKNYE